MALIGKIITWIILGVAAVFALCEPVSADQFGITPTSLHVEIEGGRGEALLREVKGYDGNIEVSLKDIPLEYEPRNVVVADGARDIRITFHGKGTGQTYEGFLRLKPVIDGRAVGVGIQLPLTVVDGESSGPLDFTGHEKFLSYFIAGFVVIIVGFVIFISSPGLSIVKENVKER